MIPTDRPEMQQQVQQVENDGLASESVTGTKGAADLDHQNHKQFLYRTNALRFFNLRENYERLEKLVVREDLGTILFYFVKHFEPERPVRTKHGLICIADDYRAALTSHMKRYFDFLSREGRGDLIWYGERNPGIPVRPDLSNTVVLPLPRLVAYQWLIYNDLDIYLWNNFDRVQTSFAEHVLDAKRRYQQASHQRLEAATATEGASSSDTQTRASERDRMRKNRSRRDAKARATVIEVRGDSKDEALQQ